MSEDNRYNGWTNYETWLANLWIDNDQGSQEYWRERAETAMELALENGLECDWPDWSYQRQAASDLAEEMKESHEEAMDELKLDGFFADMLRGAMSEIDWREIAQHYTDDIKVYMAEWHFPGCLPDGDPAYFLDEEQARNYLAEEIEGLSADLDHDEEISNDSAREMRETGATYYNGMNWCVEEVK